MNRKKLATYAFMGKFYFGHHLGRMWPFGRREKEDALAKFMANYREDRILPLTPEERAAFPGFQACVSCGLCTAECVLTRPAGEAASEKRLDPRALAVSYARAIPEFRAARELLETCDACGLCEEVCPTDTPLKRLARFITDKLEAGAA